MARRQHGVVLTGNVALESMGFKTFVRMAMSDYETVALTCGGHTFGKVPGRRQRGAGRT